MKIRSHAESHLVELEDGSRWQIFPADIDLTLGWKPETELKLVKIDDDVSSHVLVSKSGPVRVIRFGTTWRVKKIRSMLRGG